MDRFHTLRLEPLDDWYRDRGRSLPWRETTDPYLIWLSEIMLQQTQVDTVREYYEAFRKRFPDLATLAAADEDAVLKLWEGLGYYARARRMLQAARLIVRDHGGRFPRSFDAVCALPGVGESTAGAIVSAAYRDRQPVLDGNVKRVFLRLADSDALMDRAAVVRELWTVARRLVERAADPFLHNQALMDLGATICLPRNPLCQACPLADQCDGLRSGRAPSLPNRSPRPKVPHHTIAVGIMVRNDEVYIQRRPSEAMLGGLWEFPGGKQEPDESLVDTVRREFREELGVTVDVGKELACVRHAYSHFRITLHAFLCTLREGTPVPAAASEGRFVPVAGLDDFAFPTANRRILDVLLNRKM